MRLGIFPRPLTVAEVLAQRLFPSRVKLPARLRHYYFRRVPTRGIPRGRRHELRLAI